MRNRLWIMISDGGLTPEAVRNGVRECKQSAVLLSVRDQEEALCPSHYAIGPRPRFPFLSLPILLRVCIPRQRPHVLLSITLSIPCVTFLVHAMKCNGTVSFLTTR